MQLRQVCLAAEEVGATHKRESDCLSLAYTDSYQMRQLGAIIGKEDTYRQTSTGTLRKINRNGKDGSSGASKDCEDVENANRFGWGQGGLDEARRV